MTAQYSGNAVYAASSSPVWTQVVNPPVHSGGGGLDLLSLGVLLLVLLARSRELLRQLERGLG
jgi:hypothetical protein